MKRKMDTRPWGDFIQFTENEPSTVKIITVLPHEELSLQYHEKRSEFWRILSGNPIIIIADKRTEGNPGDEFTIAEKIQHRIQAQDQKVEILEIATGEFDEHDIVRLEDKYGRS